MPIVYAGESVSGTGRLDSGSTQTVPFSLEAYSSTVNSIVSSVKKGPNQTNSASLPVDKIYGVNVSTHLPFYPGSPHADRSATGSCLNHDKIRRFMSGKKTDIDVARRMSPTEWLAMEGEFVTEETAPSVVSQNGPSLHTLVANGPMLPSRSVSTTFIS